MILVTINCDVCLTEVQDQPLHVRCHMPVRVEHPEGWGWAADGVTALCPECLAQSQPRPEADPGSKSVGKKLPNRGDSGRQVD